MNNIEKIDISKLKTLLLDLDGTLINSEKAFFNSFKKVLKEKFDLTITMEDYKKYELEQNAKLLFAFREKGIINNISDKDIMNLIYEDYEHEFKKVILESESIDNFKMLKELKKLKLSLALVTTCRRYYLNILIKKLHLENLFDIIVAREDVLNLKPSSEAYLKSINFLGINKENCLAFEDSKRGIDAAVNCGLQTIQVNNFTSIKYFDDRAINFNSANDALRKILTKIKETKK